VRRLSQREIKNLQESLKKQYGVEDAFDGLVLYISGGRRIRATTPETAKLARKLRKVQQIGLYVAKLSKAGVSLSPEGSQLLDDAIKKNIVELSEEEAELWMKAAPLTLHAETEGIYVVGRLGKLYLGSGRVSRDGKIYPQIAKWRRIPEKS